MQASVITSLTSEFRVKPMTGWRRDTGELSAETLKRIETANRNAKAWHAEASEASAKVKSYEDLAQSEVEVRFSAFAEPSSTRFSGEEVIREFAVPLSRGTDSSEIQIRLFTLIKHTRDTTITELDPSSIYNVELFFEVFEIIDEAQRVSGNLRIRDDKKYLLKAAFKPLSKVIQERNLDDEIPF